MESNFISRYQESVEFLYSRLPMFSRVGAAAYKPGLDTSLRLDEYFGHPHRRFRSIHIGGTNGKGSTSHMLASVLQAQGYKVGLYTSPHLVDFRERMRVNGSMIPEGKVVEFVDRWKKSGYEGSPSFFELTMMMAFNWFAEENVDYAIVEVGMGGRLDSTNIITPVLSVITNISHDHNQFLGSSLQEIAREKAGIIKKHVPVVIGERQPESAPIFLEKAAEMESPIWFASDSPVLSEISAGEAGTWNCRYPGGQFVLNYGGDYQKKNIETVLAAVNQLRKTGMAVNDESIITGMNCVGELTGLAGRWMVLSTDPLIIADTGHNIAGLSYNFAQLDRLMKKRKNGKLRVIIGFVADKAIGRILSLLPRDARYYVTNARIPRALPAGELYEKMNVDGFVGEMFPDVAAAFMQAKKEASPEDIIFVGGSTFIVADLLSELQR